MPRPISHLSNKWDAFGGDFQPSRCEKTLGTQDPSFSHLVIRPVLPEEGPSRVPCCAEPPHGSRDADRDIPPARLRSDQS